MQKFENVDVLAALGEIMRQNTAFYRNDFDIDKEIIKRAAASDQAVDVVIDAGQASTSLLQRRCKLGYARAARIMDEMEQKSIIGPYEGAKPRAVLISRQQWLEMQMNQPEE